MTADRDTTFDEAQRLQGQNRVPEAIAAYQRALRARPEHANSWFNLGLLFRQARRPADALESYQRALNLGISNPEEVHVNRGVIYADFLRQDAEAERELRTALALRPNFVPALLNLANMQEDRGQREEALKLYSRVLELDPQCHLALARFANMQRPAHCDEALVGRIQAALAHPSTNGNEKALLGFALGRVLDARGEYAQAFNAYSVANATVRSGAMSAGYRYDRGAQEQLIDRLMRSGAGSAAGKPASAGPAPIFLCGMFRSGSTLAEQLLGQHPGVTAGGELYLLPSMVASELAPFPESLATKPAAEIEQLAQRYLESLATLFPGAQRVTDKRPDNFLYIGLIKSMFPDAKIIHTTRDALDNCLAIYFLDLDPGMSYATDLMDIGHYYRSYRRLMSHWRELYGADIIELNYDAYVREPASVAEPVFGALGLDWDPKFLDHSRAQAAVRTASVWQVREPLYQSSSGRSRNYAAQLGDLESYLTDPPLL